jgi:hypothetical protein
MRICKLLSFLFFFMLFQTPTIATADKFPYVVLRITIQQKTEGVIEKGYHLLTLICTPEYCSMRTVSLNQCVETSSGEKAFYPNVQHSSTWEGNLKITTSGNTIIVQETGGDIGGEYVNTLRFEYEPEKGRIATKLIGFSGGYVKNSLLLSKVVTTDYIPLPQPHQVITLDCGVQLPGLNKK